MNKKHLIVGAAIAGILASGTSFAKKKPKASKSEKTAAESTENSCKGENKCKGMKAEGEHKCSGPGGCHETPAVEPKGEEAPAKE